MDDEQVLEPRVCSMCKSTKQYPNTAIIGSVLCEECSQRQSLLTREDAEKGYPRTLSRRGTEQIGRESLSPQVVAMMD